MNASSDKVGGISAVLISKQKYKEVSRRPDPVTMTTLQTKPVVKQLSEVMKSNSSVIDFNSFQHHTVADFCL